MIIVVILITLHDLLLSNTLSLPLVLRHRTLAQLRTSDIVASGLEFWVPIVFSISMLIMWFLRLNVWVRRVAVVFLAWATVRLVIKVALVVNIIVSRPQSGIGVLLKDVIGMWPANFLLFGVWYWIIDGGGPDAHRDHSIQRYDFGFPQRTVTLPRWKGWQPRVLDYIYFGFSSSTQFGLGDTTALSIRAKLLLMLQVILSLIVIVFIASVAITLIR